MSQFWPPVPRELRQHGTQATSASGYVTVTYPIPFATKPVLKLTAIRTGPNLIIPDAPDINQSGSLFATATYTLGGGLVAGLVHWEAIGTPA